MLQRLSRNAGWVTHLMLNEMPDDIEDGFSQQNTSLLPGKNESDFEADCSCPDYANPCKHIAGMYYRLATLLDNEPMLLFQLRGLSLETLHHELEQSPPGQALMSQMGEAAEVTVTSAPTFFTQPLDGRHLGPLRKRGDGVRSKIFLQKHFGRGNPSLKHCSLWLLPVKNEPCCCSKNKEIIPRFGTSPLRF